MYKNKFSDDDPTRPMYDRGKKYANTGPRIVNNPGLESLKASRKAEQYMELIGKGIPLIDASLTTDQNYNKARNYADLHSRLTMQALNGEPFYIY